MPKPNPKPTVYVPKMGDEEKPQLEKRAAAAGIKLIVRESNADHDGATANLLDTYIHLNATLRKHLPGMPLEFRVLLAPSVSAIYPGGVALFNKQGHIVAPLVFPCDKARLAELQRSDKFSLVGEEPKAAITYCTCVWYDGPCEHVCAIDQPFVMIANDVYLPAATYMRTLTRSRCQSILLGMRVHDPSDSDVQYECIDHPNVMKGTSIMTQSYVPGAALYSHADIYPFMMAGDYQVEDIAVSLSYEDVEWPHGHKIIVLQPTGLAGYPSAAPAQRQIIAKVGPVGTAMALPRKDLLNGVTLYEFGGAFGYTIIVHSGKTRIFLTKIAKAIEAHPAAVKLDVSAINSPTQFASFRGQLKADKTLPEMDDTTYAFLFVYATAANLTRHNMLISQAENYGFEFDSKITRALGRTTMTLDPSDLARKLIVIATGRPTIRDAGVEFEQYNGGWYRPWHTYALWAGAAVGAVVMAKRYNINLQFRHGLRTMSAIDTVAIKQFGETAVDYTAGKLAQYSEQLTPVWDGIVERVKLSDADRNVVQATTVAATAVSFLCGVVPLYEEALKRIVSPSISGFLFGWLEGLQQGSSVTLHSAFHRGTALMPYSHAVLVHGLYNFGVLSNVPVISAAAGGYAISTSMFAKRTTWLDTWMSFCAVSAQLELITGFMSGGRWSPAMFSTKAVVGLAAAAAAYAWVGRGADEAKETEAAPQLVMDKEHRLYRPDGGAAIADYDGTPVDVVEGHQYVATPALCSEAQTEVTAEIDPQVEIVGGPGRCTKSTHGGWTFGMPPGVPGLYRHGCDPSFYAALCYRYGRVRGLPRVSAFADAAWLSIDSQASRDFDAVVAGMDAIYVSYEEYRAHFAEKRKRDRLDYLASRYGPVQPPTKATVADAHVKTDEIYRIIGFFWLMATVKPGRIIAETPMFKATMGAPYWGAETFINTQLKDRFIAGEAVVVPFKGDGATIARIMDRCASFVDAAPPGFVTLVGTIDVKQADNTWVYGAVMRELRFMGSAGLLPNGSAIHGEYNTVDVGAISRLYVKSRLNMKVSAKGRRPWDEVSAKPPNPATPSGDIATSGGTTYKTALAASKAIEDALLTVLEQSGVEGYAPRQLYLLPVCGDDNEPIVHVPVGFEATFTDLFKSKIAALCVEITGGWFRASSDELRHIPLCSSVFYPHAELGYNPGQMLGRFLTGFLSIPARVPESRLKAHMLAKCQGVSHLTPSPIARAIARRVQEALEAEHVVARYFEEPSARMVQSAESSHSDEGAMRDFEAARYALSATEYSHLLAWIEHIWQPGKFLNHPAIYTIVHRDLVQEGLIRALDFAY